MSLDAETARANAKGSSGSIPGRQADAKTRWARKPCQAWGRAHTVLYSARKASVHVSWRALGNTRARSRNDGGLSFWLVAAEDGTPSTGISSLIGVPELAPIATLVRSMKQTHEVRPGDPRGEAGIRGGRGLVVGHHTSRRTLPCRKPGAWRLRNWSLGLRRKLPTLSRTASLVMGGGRLHGRWLARRAFEKGTTWCSPTHARVRRWRRTRVSLCRR